MNATTNAIDQVPFHDFNAVYDTLQAGDKITYNNRTIPCTVARVVTPNDRIGQTLTMRTLNIPKADTETDLVDGDLLAMRSKYHLTGKRFVLIKGPRGGFYAFAKALKHGETAVYRCVRDAHETRYGWGGQGGFRYEKTEKEGLITIVERGDEPDILDEVGDLTAYENVKDRQIAIDYDETTESHIIVDTVESLFDDGLIESWNTVESQLAGETVEPNDGPAYAPAAEVQRSAPGATVGVEFTEIVETQYGQKAVLKTPAPWNTPDELKPPNEIIKSTPWEKVHYEFDKTRKAWLIDVSELKTIASEFKHYGYDVSATYQD